MKRIILVVFMALALTGCVQSVGNPKADAANNLIAMKANSITVFQGIADGCQKSLIAPAQCQKAQELYPKVQLAFRTAEDSLALAVSSGDMTQANANAAVLQSLLNDVTAIKAGGLK